MTIAAIRKYLFRLRVSLPPTLALILLLFPYPSISSPPLPSRLLPFLLSSLSSFSSSSSPSSFSCHLPLAHCCGPPPLCYSLLLRHPFIVSLAHGSSSTPLTFSALLSSSAAVLLSSHTTMPLQTQRLFCENSSYHKKCKQQHMRPLNDNYISHKCYSSCAEKNVRYETMHLSPVNEDLRRQPVLYVKQIRSN